MISKCAVPILFLRFVHITRVRPPLPSIPISTPKTLKNYRHADLRFLSAQNDIAPTDKAAVEKFIKRTVNDNNDNANKLGYNLFAYPGTLNADRVIAQSENIQQIFYKTNKKLHNKSKDYSIDEFVPLGSPKFDKVINSRRENFHFPLEWISIMENKKVIFYNSTILGLGAADDAKKYLNKLLDVITVFSRQEDVALWWRPHPFVLNVFKKLRRSLLISLRM